MLQNCNSTEVANRKRVHMDKKTFAIKGDICFAKELGKLETYEDSYLVCENGLVAGIFKELPEQYRGIEIKDYSGRLICPGMSDIHVHAPQYSFRGLGMDLELLEWLDTNTFPEESHYRDMEYAKKAYDIFTEDMRVSATTRAVVFATIHKDATEYLMQSFDNAGLGAYIGKVNMDRNSPDFYVEGTDESVKTTLEWLDDVTGRYPLVKPIITPRFVPSCTDELMKELGRIAVEKKLPVQSHLSENLSEIDWVKSLAPDSKGYADAYDRFGMFGTNTKTVMAHCIHMRDDEIELMKKQGVFVAHCPQSNMNLRSGISPIRKFLDAGIKIGLASDLAGGASINMFAAVTDAIQVSKLYWRIIDDTKKALTFPEAFFLATKGGGEFFGKVGSFEEGYEFDALVIDDSMARTPLDLSAAQRLERTMYLCHSNSIVAKFVAGKQIV